ncbi:MAG: hypothetical protein ACRDLA_14655 [Thermoleophilaceae bacterium]
MSAHACAQELVDLDYHWIGNDQLAAEAGDELGGKQISLVAPVGRGDERPGVSDDVQRLADTSSVRYLSTARPRSSGPSPDAT